ncbi:MAG: cation:proton antiporter [Candidatus Zixiibacteriota bacterium]|nr:MAG: cation:proton antiporter [candidate division Zixibacteria bacterium]
MNEAALSQMALTISLALLFGIIIHSLSQHLRIPSIVLLLGAGALLGPDLLGWIKPESVNFILPAMISYAVAVILFEGGMNLELKRLRRESTVLRRLVTYGAFITAVGGTLAARILMGWDWNISVLFGTLVIVTGPTVITPLLRRIKLNQNLHTLLEAEGVLIDPIGAIIAIGALEVVLHPSEHSFLYSIIDGFLRIGAGTLLGIAGGLVIVVILRPKNIIPEGLENVFTLAAVLALFQLSDRIIPESGIAAVTIAGLVVGNFGRRVLRDLREFKEQLTVLLIAMLFILLAADVRFEKISLLGWPGVITVIFLMIIVRPVGILICTLGLKMKIRDLVFLSWLAPRGIVAAAIASFFAVALNKAGIPGGDLLRALVFLVIAVTVTVQGLSAGMMARLLKIRRETGRGFAILGANEVARVLALEIKNHDERAVLMDSNAVACNLAEEDGLKVIFGNAMDERVLLRARIEDMAACIGLTPNEELNLLFVNRAREQFKLPKRMISISESKGHTSIEAVTEDGISVLFGSPYDIDLWAVRLRRKIALVERWSFEPNDESRDAIPVTEIPSQSMLPLLLLRKENPVPVDNKTEFQPGDLVSFIVFGELREDALEWFRQNGWIPPPGK